MTRAGRYAQGEANRQAVLDYVNKHPGALGPEIYTACGLKPDTGSSILSRMVTKYKELTRERAVWFRVSEDGTEQKAIGTYAYTAIATKTRSADEIVQSFVAVLQRPKEERKRERLEPKPDPKQPWITRNVDPERPPLKCQDAMGSSGLRFGLQSSFSMV